MTFYEQEVRRLRQLVYPRSEISRQIMAVKLYIDQHFAERLDLGMLARCAMISKFHFLRLFKLHYGVTPHQYLMEVRLSEAKRLLIKGLAASEVCAAVGFDSVSSFKGLFRQYWGRAPGSWKKGGGGREKSNFRDGAGGKLR